jgi:tetratricopeptide (TPR) repeat protein
MRAITRFIPLILILALTACGDKQQDRAREAERHERTAAAYQSQGQFRAAMIEARNAIQQQPDKSTGYLLLAHIYNQVGAYSSTQSLLESLQEKMPDTRLVLAEAYVYGKKHRSALNLLNDYAPAEGEDLQRLTLMAYAHIALGDTQSAEKALQQMAALPDAEAAEQVQYLRAAMALSQGKQETAAQILSQLLSKNPEHLKALTMAGEIALYNNKLEVAEEHLTKALTLAKTSDIMTIDRVMILSHLTQVLIQQGRTSEAYAYQKLLADANPEGQAVQQKFADAVEFYQQGKLQEAKQLLSEIHEQHPSDKNAGTLLGLVQYQQGQNEEALELFNQYIDTETANPSVIQAAAVAKYRTNRADEALSLLQSAVENQPNDPTLLATYGLALLDQDGTSSQGALAIEKSLAINPAQQRLRIALAKRHLNLDQPEQALAQLQKAYSELPQDVLIEQTYFDALLKLGKASDAEALVKQLRTADANNPRGHFLEGWLQLHQKAYRKAQASFSKALENTSGTDRAMAYSGLAQAHEQAGQLQEAANVWQTALKEDPAMIAAYSRWLALMEKLNKGDQALAYLTELESQKKYWQPSVVLAQLYYNQRQIDSAIQHIETALTRSQQEGLVKRVAANLYSQKGVEFKQQRAFADARINLMKAHELNPDNILYLANLIDLELVAGRIAEAQKLLDQYPRSDENLAAYLFLQGAIHRADKKPDAALKFYQQSWAEKPSDNAGEAIYTHYQQAGEQAEAQSMLEKWISAMPQSPRPTLIKALNAHQRNDIQEAVIWYEATLELAPDLVAAINNLAWIYNEQKDPRALETARKAYEMAPKSPDILDTYGWILVEQGQVAEGIKHLEEASRIAPDNKEILEHLSQAKARLK